MECWAEIEGYPDYLVSDHGNIYSQITRKILKPQPTGTGLAYLMITLYNNQIPKQISIHTLVARHFLYRASSILEVNHKDRNGWNNHVSNLEWVTHQYNMEHAHMNDDIASPGRPAQKVRIVETGEVFRSISDCARYIGGQEAHIRDVLKGRRKRHRGYTFQHAG